MTPETERYLIQQLNRRLDHEQQKITISRSGKPARYLLHDKRTGNLEAWSDILDGWMLELGVPLT